VAAALVCAVLIAIAATWSTLYTFQADSPQPKPALAARPGAPAPAAAPAPGTSAKGLNGTYRLDYDRSKRTTNGVPIRHDGADTSWWAFHSVCTANGCGATGVLLDDANHQVVSSTDGGQTDVLRFVGGYWQGVPQQERVGCRQPNGPVRATQEETVAWSLAPQADGTLRGVETETVLSNDCGAQGSVLRVPVVANRVGDVPPSVTLDDPTKAVAAPAAPSAKPSPPVLGGACSDVDKLAYDQTSNEQVVCEGSAWGKAPITTGVHAAGSSCNRPDIAVFAMSASNDGYLLECDPVTRMWIRHA
jgi:serine/threonine-protein kinase